MKNNLPKIGFEPYEPKRKSKFTVEFVGTDIEQWTVCRANRPSYTLNEGWDDMEIYLIDAIGPSTSQAVYKGIIKKGLTNRKINMRLLDPTGVEIERWSIYGNYKNIDFGGNDYEDSEPLYIKLKFGIETCILEQ